MLNKSNRLLKKKDFDAVWQRGRSSFDKILGIKVLANGRELNRFGVLAGLKFSKKAVERNKVKRRLRELIRHESPLLNDGFDIILTVLPAARSSKFAELQRSLHYNLRKLRIIKS
jgi:ribonuclease P protein component